MYRTHTCYRLAVHTKFPIHFTFDFFSENKKNENCCRMTRGRGYSKKKKWRRYLLILWDATNPHEFIYFSPCIYLTGHFLFVRYAHACPPIYDTQPFRIATNWGGVVCGFVPNTIRRGVYTPFRETVLPFSRGDIPVLPIGTPPSLRGRKLKGPGIRTKKNKVVTKRSRCLEVLVPKSGHASKVNHTPYRRATRHAISIRSPSPKFLANLSPRGFLKVNDTHFLRHFSQFALHQEGVYLSNVIYTPI